MDFLVENQPANAESISSSLWYFHCVLMICCRNRFICYLIFDKNCSICCHKSAKQSITLKRTSPFSQGCCTSRLGNPMEWWFEIYLPSKQPESWTLWQKRHPIYFLYLHWQPFCDSILCQHCRHFPIIAFAPAWCEPPAWMVYENAYTPLDGAVKMPVDLSYPFHNFFPQHRI